MVQLQTKETEIRFLLPLLVFCCASHLCCLSPLVGGALEKPVDSEIRQLCFEVFDESAPTLSPDEVLKRVTKLETLYPETNLIHKCLADSYRLLDAKDLIAKNCLYENVNTLEFYMYTMYKAHQVNAVPYLKDLVITQLSKCADLVQSEVATKIEPERQRNLKQLNSMINAALDEGQTRVRGESVRLNKKIVKAVIEFIKQHGGLANEEDKSEDYFFEHFKRIVGDPCLDAWSVLESSIDGIRRAVSDELLVLADADTREWVDVLDSCSSVWGGVIVYDVYSRTPTESRQQTAPTATTENERSSSSYSNTTGIEGTSRASTSEKGESSTSRTESENERTPTVSSVGKEPTRTAKTAEQSTEDDEDRSHTSLVDTHRLLNAKDLIAKNDCSYDNLNTLQFYMNSMYEAENVNSVKDLVITQLGRCSSLAQNEVAAKIQPEQQRILKQLNSMINSVALDEGQTRVRGESVKLTEKVVKSVIDFIKQNGGHETNEAERSEAHFMENFKRIVGDPCRNAWSVLERPIDGIRRCNSDELLVLVDADTKEWVDVLDTCSSLGDGATVYSRYSAATTPTERKQTPSSTAAAENEDTSTATTDNDEPSLRVSTGREPTTPPITTHREPTQTPATDEMNEGATRTVPSGRNPTIKFGSERSVDSDIRQLCFEVFDEWAASVSPDEVFRRLTKLETFNDGNGGSVHTCLADSHRLLRAKDLIRENCLYENVNTLESYMNTMYQEHQVNVVPYLKDLVITQLGECSSLVQREVTTKIESGQQRNLKQLNSMINAALDEGQTRVRGEFVKLTKNIVKAVIEFMKQHGGLANEAERSEAYFMENFKQFVEEPCRNAKSALDNSIDGIRRCGSDELLVLVDADTKEWADVLDSCSSLGDGDTVYDIYYLFL